MKSWFSNRSDNNYTSPTRLVKIENVKINIIRNECEVSLLN